MKARWEWRFAEAAGGVLERPGSPVFDARYDAEEWLGTHWRALAAQRVATATLLHEGIAVPPAIAIPLTPSA